MAHEFVDEAVQITVDKAAALVLFEWLFQAYQQANTPVDDPAVMEALSQVFGQLESTLVEPLWPDYGDVIDEAKRRIVL